MKQSGMIAFLEFEGVEPTPDEYADLDPVGPGFFSTLGVPILRGRDILATDTKDSQPVTVINSALAEKYWPGQDPIGKRLKSAGGKGAEVVGVVADFKMHSLREPAPPTLFVPAAQHYLPRMTIAVRSVGDPEGILSSIRTAVTRVDPSLAVFDTRTAEEQLGVLLAEERIVAWLLVTFAGLAAILTATGFYGAFAYHTRLRTREYAIRLALGARSGQLLSLVLMRGVSLAVTGVGLGIAVTYALSGVLASLLFGVAPVDPATFAAAALVLVGIPVVASFIPARRASRVDPAVALRDE
jgi:putative ABC transport system permease protein